MCDVIHELFKDAAASTRLTLYPVAPIAVKCQPIERSPISNKSKLNLVSFIFWLYRPTDELCAALAAIAIIVLYCAI